MQEELAQGSISMGKQSNAPNQHTLLLQADRLAGRRLIHRYQQAVLPATNAALLRHVDQLNKISGEDRQRE